MSREKKAKAFTIFDYGPMFGASVMMLQSAAYRLQVALEENDIERLYQERIYANRVIKAYEKAKTKAPPSSMLTQAYRRIAISSLEDLDTILEIASCRLSSSLKCL